MPSEAFTIEFASRETRRMFEGLVRMVRADSLDQVAPCLRELSHAVDDDLIVAGYITYEAAPAFDSTMSAHAPLFASAAGVRCVRRNA